MLEELHVRDLALIQDVWIEFGPGLNVLTGETGAGKTVLLGALKLLLGERADSSAVRTGATEALVEGRFVDGADETVARRRLSADGRSKCTLSGEMATVGALAEVVGPLVDLHGQHEHQALLRPGTHAAYLDAWVGKAATEALGCYRTARTVHSHASEELAQLEVAVAEAARDADYLRFVLEEIDRLEPHEGEDDALQAMLPALQHSERLAEAASSAAAELRGDGGALDRVATALQLLARVGDIDPALDDLASRIAELQTLLDDASSSLRGYRDAVEHDPAALESTLARLSALSGLTKKYGPGLHEVLERRDHARRALAAVEGSGDALGEARAALEAAEVELRRAAAGLQALRAQGAPAFVSALAEACSDLAMADARFEVAFGDLEFEQWTGLGPQRVEFLYAPAKGQPARPLAKIASGGELSRVMLALKGVLGSADSIQTLVFDEIDAGIGGSTADAVGKRLAQLSRTHQVVVVTHLAQVAAYATSHVVVSKSSDGDSVATVTRRVEGDDRVEEMARMLSGNDSEVSKAHARELMDQAARSL